jgi:hypothetical protein
MNGTNTAAHELRGSVTVVKGAATLLNESGSRIALRSSATPVLPRDR